MAKRYFISREFSKAKESIDQSISLDQHDYESLCMLAEIFFNDNTIAHPDQVISALERAFRIKNGTLVNILFSRYYQLNGDDEKAILYAYRAFDLYLKECPFDIELLQHF